MLHSPEPPVRLWSHAAAMTAPDAAIAICLLLLIALLARPTQLRRANAALTRRNLELESATEAKSRFVANLSHELRNPLNAVIGFAELMQDERVTPLTARQREHLGIIRASGEHLLTLIDEALDMSRVEAGHVRLEPEEIEPTAIAAVCATSLGRLAAAKTIRIDLDPRPLGTVRLDPARLRQVILNYLSNAIKFTGEGGTIRVGLEHHHGRLLVEVSDTGQGIHPADHHRVFEEFVQLPSGDRSGSGLGLAVTKLVVEAQGGEVGVRSRPGEGSTFSAWLPAPAAVPARKPAVAPARKPAGPSARTALWPAPERRTAEPQTRALVRQ
jgi:signal transduction histidine kinase